MPGQDGIAVISDDATFEGTIRNCKSLEIYGFVKGRVAADNLIVHKGGDFYGEAKTGATIVSGTLQGDIVVDGLIRIEDSGVVAGQIAYGRLAMAAGGNLSADMRNVPPRLMGDLSISVLRGRSVRITTDDITAVDPDNSAAELTFHVSNSRHGTVLGGAEAGRFTQADLLAGRVIFSHDGSEGSAASFDVDVSDSSGGSSGAPQTVAVTVLPV